MDPRICEDDMHTLASEAKGPLPAEEGWVMEKKKRKKKKKRKRKKAGIAKARKLICSILKNTYLIHKKTQSSSTSKSL